MINPILDGIEKFFGVNMELVEFDRYADLAAKAFTAYFKQCQLLRDDLIPVEFEDLPHEFSLGWIAAVKEIERVLNETTSDNQ